jgi:plasmid stabilization system protein ParE
VILFDEGAQADLERIFEFNFERDPTVALQHVEKIMEAVLILDRHPEIGRRVAGEPPLRELVISHGSSGYIALYDHSRVQGIVRVVAIRHQREAGYRES